jgi:hypothetical protein
MNGLNVTAAQARALAAYALNGRRMYIDQADEDRLHGGPVHVAIGAPTQSGGGFRRLAEVTIAENGTPDWKPVATRQGAARAGGQIGAASGETEPSR